MYARYATAGHLLSASVGRKRDDAESEAPRKWCEPEKNFGKYNATSRVWLAKATWADPWERETFRAAVIQHAIVAAVRKWKGSTKFSQEQLAAADGRWGSRPEDLPVGRRWAGEVRWNEKLNGREELTARDLAVILRVVPPGVLPQWEDIQDLIRVAEGDLDPPPDSVDRSAASTAWPDSTASAGSA